MNINDLYGQSVDAPEASYDDRPLLTEEEMPTGTVVLAKIVYSDARVGSGGGPGLVNKLEVVDGDLAGRQFFDSIYLSVKSGDGARSYNKRMFAKLEATGLDANFFSANPSMEAIAKAIKDKTVSVKIKWDEPGADGRQFLSNNTTWSPVSTAPAGYTPSY